MSTMSTTGPAVLICGREICGTGTGRYVSFRLTLPNNLHHASPNGDIIDYVDTRYSYVEALRAALLTEFPSGDLTLPALDSKRLMGSLSSSVVNQRTRIINNFLRTVQEESRCTTSRPWGEFLRGMKPGVGQVAVAHAPTPAELRGTSAADAAPRQTLSENPAAVQGLSFGWLLENFTLFNDEEQTASAPPEYTEGDPSSPQRASEPTLSPVRESISNNIDSDDEDAIESIAANSVAVVTPRQVMRQEFYNMVQARRGRAVSGAHGNMIMAADPSDLEDAENAGAVFQKSLPPLAYEFVGCFFLGLVLNLSRVTGTAATLDRTYLGLLNMSFTIAALTYSLGHVSGGHLNPSVSLAVFFRRHLTFGQLVLYAVSQFAGFVLSCVVVKLQHDGDYAALAIDGMSATDFPPLPHSRRTKMLDDYEAMVIVAIFVFGLSYTVLCTSTSAAQTGNSHYGLAAGLITSVGMMVSEVLGTGSSLNPAFDGALVVNNFLWNPSLSTLKSSASFLGETPMWAPWLAGPTIGALLAGLVYRYIKVTAFSKRNHGCCNTFFKSFAPFMTELLGTYLISLTFLLFTHLVDESAEASAKLQAYGVLAGAYMAMTIAVVYAGGFISGGHYNPAITLGVAMQGKMPAASAVFYVLMQCAAAFGASTSLWYVLDATPVPGSMVEEHGLDLKVASFEFLFSFLLVFVVLNATVAKANRGNGFFGMVYGFVLNASVMCAGMISGGAVNPGIAVGSYFGRWLWNCDGCSGGFTDATFWSGFDAGSWVCMGVPMIAALVAGLFFRQAVTGGVVIKCGGKKKMAVEEEEGRDGSHSSMQRLSEVPIAGIVSQASGDVELGNTEEGAPSTPQRADRRTSL